ncbi:MAG: hypothetical protein OQJ97_13165 [Rhodospirillales bacterium]|nr:hypothetical protein [Rhodospirillales bacterium]
MDKMRRLSDKILYAHRQACTENRPDIARLLLEALELDLSQVGGDMEEHREDMTTLEAAFELHNTTFG